MRLRRLLLGLVASALVAAAPAAAPAPTTIVDAERLVTAAERVLPQVAGPRDRLAAELCRFAHSAAALIDATPESPPDLRARARAASGRCALLSAQPAAALAALAESFALAPAPAVGLDLGRALLQLRRIDEARVILADVAPRLQGSARGLALALRADCAAAPAEAAALLKQAQAVLSAAGPAGLEALPEVLDRQAALAPDAGQEVALREAAQRLRQAFESHDAQDRAAGQVRLAAALQRDHDLARAEALLRPLTTTHGSQITPSSIAAEVRLGRVLFAAGRPVEAAMALQQAVFHDAALRRSVQPAQLDDGAAAAPEAVTLPLVFSMLARHPDQANLQRAALTLLLLRKGRAIDEQAAAERGQYRGLDEDGRRRFDQMRALQQHINQLDLARPTLDADADGAAQTRARAELAAQIGLLQEALGRRMVTLGYTQQARPNAQQIRQQVAAQLPPDAALIEYLRFRLDPEISGSAEEVYLAMTLLPGDGGQGLSAVPLGPAAAIDAAVERLRAALQSARGDPVPAAQALHHLILAPVLERLAARQHLFLSPDGALQLVPFAALHDGQGYLLDRYRLVYLTSGRDLLPPLQDQPPARGVVVVADPAFARGPLALPPLPGTRAEARALQALWPAARLLIGEEATREALLALHPASIVHIATHGFFLDGGAGALAAAGRGTSLVLAPLPQDPLLRSALALRGAAPPTVAGLQGPGLLTARDLAALDLAGTQILTLSACESGVGEARGLGEGVFGLRRAAFIAGAEAVLSSLWRVEDEVAAELMTTFYQALRAGAGRAEALRRAAQALRAGHPHPHAWAAFLLIGLEGPLRAPEPEPEPASQPALRQRAPRGGSRVLADARLQDPVLAAAAPDDVWIGGEGVLLHFDGAQVREVPGLQKDQRVTSLLPRGPREVLVSAAAADGSRSLYRCDGRRVYELEPWLFRGLNWHGLRLVDASSVGQGVLLLGAGGALHDQLYALRFDGQRWSPAAQRIGPGAAPLAWTADGALWVAAGSGERYRAQGGQWEPVPLPALLGANHPVAQVTLPGASWLLAGGPDPQLCRLESSAPARCRPVDACNLAAAPGGAALLLGTCAPGGGALLRLQPAADAAPQVLARLPFWPRALAGLADGGVFAAGRGELWYYRPQRNP